MPQVQPIYLPSQRRETLGSDIGGLLGAAVGASFVMKEREKDKEEKTAFMEGIRKAPSRAAAFEVVSNYTSKMRTPQDYTTALRLVDEMHPASLDTPTPMPAYDDMGKKTTVFPTRKDMGDPNFWKKSGVTLTEPDMVEFFQPVPALSTTDPNADPKARPMYEQVGKLPINKRPSGAMTKDEISLAHRDEADIRAERAAERADVRLGQSEQRMLDAQKRTEGVMARLADNMADKDIKSGQNASLAFTRLAAVSLNGRILPDGTFDFAGDVSKVDQFTKMVDYWNTRIEANPNLLKSPTTVTKLFTEARRAVIPVEEKSKKAPKGESDGGLVSGVKDWWKKTTAPPGEETTGKKSEVKGKSASRGMNPEDVQASVRSAKDAAARVRESALSVTEKTKLLNTIRKRLKDAGISEEI